MHACKTNRELVFLLIRDFLPSSVPPRYPNRYSFFLAAKKRKYREKEEEDSLRRRESVKLCLFGVFLLNGILLSL